jgi:hypothetical protein
MAGSSRFSSQELYEMALLGLAWMRIKSPNVLGRTGSSIMWALYHAGVIGDPINEGISGDPKLIAMAMRNAKYWGYGTPNKKRLKYFIANSRYELLTLTPGGLVYDKLFGGPEGHRHVISEMGIAHAMSVAWKHEGVIDFDGFCVGWDIYARKVSGMQRTLKERETARGY